MSVNRPGRELAGSGERVTTLVGASTPLRLLQRGKMAAQLRPIGHGQIKIFNLSLMRP
jgi:hypothetical protein